MEAFKERQDLPNATAVLVLGILSIVTCCCYGVVGAGLGIIAIVLSNKAIAIYNENPDPEAWNGYGNLKAGRICAIIGLCLSALLIISVILGIILMGMDGFREVMEEYSRAASYS